MKTSNLTALIVALLVTVGGFEGINFLFTKAYYGHAPATAGRIFRA